jgi:hypothetical protein
VASFGAKPPIRTVPVVIEEPREKLMNPDIGVTFL